MRARETLLRVIELDEENELAWLWLSGAVDSDEDRETCLRNVLALNPDNPAAKRGLERLTGSSSLVGKESRSNINELTPPSAAASILYPERHRIERQWEDNIPLRKVDIGKIQGKSKYEDVWEREVILCAYCAAEIGQDTVRCPKCRRKLVARSYRYPDSSQALTMYWVLLVGVAQLYFLEAILQVIHREPAAVIVWSGLLFGFSALLAAALAFRQLWAYPISVVFLLALLVTMILDFFAGVEVEKALSTFVGDDLVSLLTVDLDLVFVQSVLGFVEIMRFAVVFGAFIYGIGKIGPDFDRIQTRYYAMSDWYSADASESFARGQAFASKGMWASAVLQWRVASANDPGRAQYLRALGEAYAKLGFYDRSLDVLKSAMERSVDKESKERVDQMIREIDKLRK